MSAIYNDGTPLLELRDVCRIYDLGEVQVEALVDIDLDVHAGEHVALVGPSGSGKSTLMNILGCLDRPSGGDYRLAGQQVATMTREQRADIRNREVGFVFQNFNLLPRTTAIENVELPLLYAKGVTRRQRRRRAVELLQRVGLGDRMMHHSGQLSGGQQQRVAIARALVNSPSIVMADEPTGNLDSHTSRDVMALFQRLNRENNITVVLVTHDQDVARYANRIIVLRDGRIAEDTGEFRRTLNSVHRSPDSQSGLDMQAAGT